MLRKQKSELPQGTLDMLILKALSLGPMHGYGVGQRIQQLAEEMLKVEEGTLYPALYRIEQRGWIESEWGTSDNNRRARFFRRHAALDILLSPQVEMKLQLFSNLSLNYLGVTDAAHACVAALEPVHDHAP